jgi:hypothetical protein
MAYRVASGESTKKLQISTTKKKEKESKKKLKSIAFSRDCCRMCDGENGVGCPRPETTTTYTKTPDKEHSICTFFLRYYGALGVNFQTKELYLFSRPGYIIMDI